MRLPEASNFAAKVGKLKLRKPGVGKLLLVSPVKYAARLESMAIDVPSAWPFGPATNVEYNKPDPSALSLVKKPAVPGLVVRDAPGVTGKSDEDVPPSTYAIPFASTAIPPGVSPVVPPR